MNEQDFLTQFENLTLPEDKFDHKGHLWLGWLYIRDHDLGEASRKLNTGIKAYAESLGAMDKFHFTITTTFACIIKSRFVDGQTFEDFLGANQDIVKNALSIIITHYSSELLFSAEAQKRLVAPDREPFPKEFEEQLIIFFR